MQRIDAVASALPLHRQAGARAIERRSLSALPPCTLVRRAGDSLGRLALALAPHASCIWIACGPGNNGADGLHAAAWLIEQGKKVGISRIVGDGTASAETDDALQRLAALGARFVDQAPTLSRDDIAIDALLGLGGRAPAGAMAAMVRTLNALPCAVLAADIPTGLDGDTGQPLGDDVVRATATLSLLALHPGLFTGQGRDQAGILWFDDLGVPAAERLATPPDAWLDARDDLCDALAPASHAAHKGSFGDVAVVAGAPGMTGAAWLASHAAHASGAGKVYVSLLDPDGPELDVTRPELMFRRRWWESDVDAIEKTTVVCGCGGGHAVEEALPPLLRHAARLVLDADALNAVSRDAGLQGLLRHRGDHGHTSVLTPHPLEAARLLGVPVGEVQRDRLQAAQALADRFDCVAVVKGSGTVIAAPSGSGLVPIVNRSGNGSLATAGTGDVLAGWLGGTWARAAAQAAGASADTSARLRVARDAATSAVLMHGAAADHAGMATLRASDLVEQLLRDRSA